VGLGIILINVSSRLKVIKNELPGGHPCSWRSNMSSICLLISDLGLTRAPIFFAGF